MTPCDNTGLCPSASGASTAPSAGSGGSGSSAGAGTDTGRDADWAIRAPALKLAPFCVYTDSVSRRFCAFFCGVQYYRFCISLCHLPWKSSVSIPHTFNGNLPLFQIECCARILSVFPVVSHRNAKRLRALSLAWSCDPWRYHLIISFNLILCVLCALVDTK